MRTTTTLSLLRRPSPPLPHLKSALGDKPVVDPPEFAERIRDTDEEPYWIPGAFPTIFQNETGDPYVYALKRPDLKTWGPHVLSSRG